MNQYILNQVVNSWTGRMVDTSELAETARDLGAGYHESWDIADCATYIICKQIDSMLEDEAQS